MFGRKYKEMPIQKEKKPTFTYPCRKSQSSGMTMKLQSNSTTRQQNCRARAQHDNKIVEQGNDTKIIEQGHENETYRGQGNDN